MLFRCAIVLGVLAIPAQRAATLSLWCVSALEPVQRPMARGGHLLGWSLDFLGTLRGRTTENERLREKVAALTEERDRWRARAAEAEQWAEDLAEFRARRQEVGRGEVIPVVEAEVIGQGTGPQTGVIFIGRGSRDGVRRGMAVAVGRSIIGTVQAVGPRASAVRLVTSPASRLDGRIASTGERGIVTGRGDGTMRMKHIWETAPRLGESVLTTGRDGWAPKHFVLGRIARVRPNPGTLTYDVTLKPVRDLGRLASVVVVQPAIGADAFPAAPGEEGG